MGKHQADNCGDLEYCYLIYSHLSYISKKKTKKET